MFSCEIWNYDEGNYTAIKRALINTNWDTLISNNVEESTANITDHILHLCKEFIPHRTILVRQSDPAWITTDIKRKIRKRNRHHAVAKQTNNQNHWTRFRATRNEVIEEIRNSKKNFLIKTALRLRDGNITPKEWWSIVKSLTKNQSDTRQIPIIIDDDGKQFSDPVGKATVLNTFFTSQTILNDENIPVPNVPNMLHRELKHIELNFTEVKSVLKKLNPNKAMGPDAVNPHVLKECGDQLAVPLSRIFNMSLQQGIYPALWKDAIVTAIFKKGDRKQPSNYRPISLLSYLRKVMDKCVLIRLYTYLTDHKLITAFQSGFTSGDSTVNKLIDIYDSICSALDDGKEVRAIFCDVQKAFDRVWHRGLVHKLSSYGIKWQLLELHSNYLSNRHQCVVIEGEQSQYKSIHAGVPQGLF